jgi:hypothetical protein
VAKKTFWRQTGDTSMDFFWRNIIAALLDLANISWLSLYFARVKWFLNILLTWYKYSRKNLKDILIFKKSTEVIVLVKHTWCLDIHVVETKILRIHTCFIYW